MQIRIYGDSLMKAVQVDEQYKYRQTAQGYLEQLQRSGIDAVNRAHFGYTAARGQRVLQKDLQSGMDCTMALLEFGGNDCDHNWQQVAAAPQAEHLPNAPLQTFLQTLRTMAQSLLQQGIQPVLMTLPPLDAQRYLDFIGRLGSDTAAVLSWLGDVQMIYRWQELYSNGIAMLAGRMGLPLIDVRSRFLARRDQAGLIARDGIHLTAEGYQLVFDTIAETLPAL